VANAISSCNEDNTDGDSEKLFYYFVSIRMNEDLSGTYQTS